MSWMIFFFIYEGSGGHAMYYMHLFMGKKIPENSNKPKVKQPPPHLFLSRSLYMCVMDGGSDNRKCYTSLSAVICRLAEAPGGSGWLVRERSEKIILTCPL